MGCQYPNAQVWRRWPGRGGLPSLLVRCSRWRLNGELDKPEPISPNHLTKIIAEAAGPVSNSGKRASVA
jgi:hypothetical protein